MDDGAVAQALIDRSMVTVAMNRLSRSLRRMDFRSKLRYTDWQLMRTEPISTGDNGLPKRSRCMELSKAYELDRVAAMSVEERIVTALSLHDRLGDLRPVEVSTNNE